MPAPVTALEALEDLVEQLAGSSFTDREGRALETTQVYRTAVQVLEDDPHFNARGVTVDADDADYGALPMHNIVPRMSGTPGVWQRPAPTIGEHNAEILGELGL